MIPYSLPHETFCYDKSPVQAEITVGKATVLKSVARSRTRFQMEPQNEPDPDIRLLKAYTYPDFVGATVAAKITREMDGEDGEKQTVELPWPMPLEQFMELPEDLIIQWEARVYEFNRAWLVGNQDAEEKKDKK